MTRSRRRGGGSTRADRPDLESGEHAQTSGNPESLARALCLRQLEARSRTRVELERYLARKLVPEDVAARVLDRFTEVGLVDDGTLARSFVSSRHTEQGLARRAIAIKLKQRGVADDVIASAVATLDSDDEALAARRVVAKKLSAVATLDRAVQTRRLVGLLGRKGYPSGLAYRVVRDALAERADSSALGQNEDRNFEDGVSTEYDTVDDA